MGPGDSTLNDGVNMHDIQPQCLANNPQFARINSLQQQRTLDPYSAGLPLPPAPPMFHPLQSNFMGYSPLGGNATANIHIPMNKRVLVTKEDLSLIINAVKAQSINVLRAAIAEELNPRHPYALELLTKLIEEI